MEKQFNPKSICRSNDLEKLTVYRTFISEDEIRYYFNDEQYVAARYNDDETIKIKYEEEKNTEQDSWKRDAWTYIKKIIKDKTLDKFSKLSLIQPFLLAILIFILGVILCIILTVKMKNILIFPIAIGFMFFLIVIFGVFGEYIATSPSLKSKISAEHMMTSFLENNRRLPKNMKEIKESPRFFAINCSMTNEVQQKLAKLAEDMVILTLPAIISYIIAYYATQDCQYKMLELIICLLIYAVIGSCIEKLHEYNKLKFIISPIKK